MRDDATKDQEFKDNAAWRRQKYRNDIIVRSQKNPDGGFMQNRAFTTNSLSGNERNRTFIRAGDNFADVSLLSGADDLADGRSFSLIDFDNDGWQDVALMSLNAPRFKLYRNRLKEFYPENRSMKIRLIGGQKSSQPNAKLSNRDGIGAKVMVTLTSGVKMLLHRQAGEGFAGQNANTLHVGLAKGDKIKSIVVNWPSGKVSTLDDPKLFDVKTLEVTE